MDQNCYPYICSSGRANVLYGQRDEYDTASGIQADVGFLVPAYIQVVPGGTRKVTLSSYGIFNLHKDSIIYLPYPQHRCSLIT